MWSQYSGRFDARYLLRIAVQYQPRPVVVDQEEARIRLLVPLHPELDEQLACDGDLLDEMLDDPVLSPLRENAELVVRDTRGAAGSKLPRFDSPQRLLQVANAMGEIFDAPLDPPQLLEDGPPVQPIASFAGKRPQLHSAE